MTHAAARFLSRFRRVVVESLVREWRGVIVGPFRALWERGPLGVSLALFATVAVIGLHAYQQTETGAAVLRVVSEVRADQPLALSLLRTPVSLFVPAQDLAVWGGLPRLFLAFALAELAFGRIRTLVVAYAATLAGTLGARVMIALGPGLLGLPADAAHAVDTGASAAIVGLFAFAAVTLRAPLLFLAAVVPTVVGSVAEPNLAGREHLVAVAAAMLLALFLKTAPAASRCQWALPESAAVDGEVGHGCSRRAGPGGLGGHRGDPGR
ncbi:putative integral membrane protein [Streptomyces formicae]|uniref:Putative integral membrane protein n=1 Tax=Streptomyces formicae TaxID=1616117 RepID=A0A291QBU4_9ACTN|nr:putative integral membrane protein [Streptomyces formicae]